MVDTDNGELEPLSGSRGADRADPHTDISLRCAHTLVEVAGPPMCRGGTTANAREATCAMGLFQCWGSGSKRGRTEVQMRTGWGMGAKKAKAGERKEKGRTWKRAGAMRGQCMHVARAPHRHCTEDPVGLTVASTRIRN